MDYPQAAGMANIFAQYLVRFGDRFQALPWDAFGNVFEGPDHTWGTISMTALVKEGSWNLWESLEPTAEYYGVYMAYMRFLDPGLDYAVVPVKSTTESVVPYAVCHLGDQDRCHVLLVNLTDTKQIVQVDRKSEKKKPGNYRTEVDVFGAEQFKWIGDQKDAYPYPKMGPSGRLLEGKNRDIEIPPFGTVVVRMNAFTHTKPTSPTIIAAALEKKVMTVGDTLDLFVTAVQEGGELAGAEIQIKKWDNKGTLTVRATPDDGKWNSSIESFHLQIPLTEKVSIGNKEIKVTITGKNKKQTSFTIPFRVRGAYRTTSVMQNFDNGLDNVSWFPVVNGDNATSMDAKVFNGNPPLGGYIRHDFIVEQPPELGWPNYSGAYYNVPEEVKKSVGIVFDYATTHNNPQGYIELQIMSSQVEDYDEFMIRLKNTRGNWVRDTLIWENMKQEGWGKTIPQLDPTKIKNFAFRARHSGKGYISLDNIYLLGEDGKEVPMPKGLRRLR